MIGVSFPHMLRKSDADHESRAPDQFLAEDAVAA